MATYKCNDGVYTVLRNGKVIAFNTTSATALTAVVSDAANVVCAPECCISDMIVALDQFDVEVTTTYPTGLSVRISITSGIDTYSTAWVACTGTDTISIVGLVVEVGGWFSGDDICVEYSYDEVTVIQGCCATVLTDTYIEDDTYDLNDIVRACDAGGVSLYELLYESGAEGVTISAGGEMVVPNITADEDLFAVHKCDGCVDELLVLTITNTVGLRLTYTEGNLPANDLAAWNAFFDLPANGTAFTSMVTAGDDVTLGGGTGITLKASLFLNNADLFKIEDDTDCVVAIAGGVGTGALSTCSALTTVTLNGVITAAREGLYNNSSLTALSMDALTTAGILCFRGCTSMATFDLPALITAANNCFEACAATAFTLPLCTTIGNNCFKDCTAATTFDLSSCTALGTTAGDDIVFNSIGGNTIAVTIPIAQQTIDGGNPDGDLVYLAANNTATITYI